MTAIPSPVDFEIFRVRGADSAEAELILSMPENARIGILWLSALGVSARNYRDFATCLAARGIACALHESRGAGSSNWRASRRCDWNYGDILHSDIPASLECARKAKPELQWIIAGHSIGGQFASLYAAANPSEIRGLALVASGSPYWRTFSAKAAFALRMAFPVIRLASMICGYFPGKRLGFAGSESRSLMRDWARSGVSGRYQLDSDKNDYEHAMARYAGPVLAVQLSQDAYAPRSSLQWLLQKFKIAAIEVVERDTGHFASGRADHFSWMKESGPVADAISDWVDRQIQS